MRYQLKPGLARGQRPFVAGALCALCVPLASGQRLLREHFGASIPLQNGGVTGDVLFAAQPMGDLNGDGFDDYVLVGKKNREFSGWYEFRSGVDGSLLAPRFTSPTPGAFGNNVVPVGDFNGDGRPDIVRGFSDFAAQAADLWSGAPIALLSAAPGVGVAGYGDSVVPLGDINGDGFDDVALATTSGVAEHIGIHLGPSGALAAQLGHPGGTGSLSISSSGDLNGDGITDLLIGDSFFSGRVKAVSMADFSTLYEIQADGGCRCNPRWGWAMAPLSDIDGDGVKDFAVSAPAGVFSGNLSGRAFLEFRSGRTGDFIRRVDEPYPRIHKVVGPNYLTHDLGKFGLFMHSHGDFNGDGYDDLVVGSPDRFEISNFSSSGAVTIISGLTGEVLADVTPLGQMESTIRRFRRGFMLGDVDGDGLAEFSIGNVLDDEAGPQSGRVWIWRGSTGDAQGYCTAPSHSGGLSARLQLDGSLSLIDEDMWLQVYDGLPGALCLFLGAAGTHTSPAGSNGLCLGTQGVFRLGQPALTQGDGLAETQLDLVGAAYAASWIPGSTWTLQAVFRDTAGAISLGRSNAVALQWGW